jgi:hypothetical protein
MSDLLDANGNKQEQESQDAPYTLVLTMDKKTLALNIGGNVLNLDTALNMLSQASRFMEVQYRIDMAVKAQEAINRNKQDMAKVAELIASRH